MSGMDELFEIKNAFFIGNYHTCIKEVQKLKPSSLDAKMVADTYMYRSYLANQKYAVVKDEISESSHAYLRPLSDLADYLSGKRGEEIVGSLEAKLNSNADPSNTNLLIVASTIFSREGDTDAALRALHLSDHLECVALRIQILLSIDRVDVARKELKAMQDADEDATLTQLAQAWFNLAAGGEKLKDAYYIYQELIDKFGSTPLLLNGQAVAFIAQGQYDEAEGVLQEAMDKDSNFPDTLINMVVLSEHIGKPPEVSRRYLMQLKDGHPTHAFVRSYQQKEKDFDRLVSTYA